MIVNTKISISLYLYIFEYFCTISLVFYLFIKEFNLNFSFKTKL